MADDQDAIFRNIRKKRVVAHKKTKRLIETPSRKSSRKSHI